MERMVLGFGDFYFNIDLFVEVLYDFLGKYCF